MDSDANFNFDYENWAISVLPPVTLGGKPDTLSIMMVPVSNSGQIVAGSVQIMVVESVTEHEFSSTCHCEPELVMVDGIDTWRHEGIRTTDFPQLPDVEGL